MHTEEIDDSVHFMWLGKFTKVTVN